MNTFQYILSLLLFVAIGIGFYIWVVWKQEKDSWNPTKALYDKGARQVQKALKDSGAMSLDQLSEALSGLSVHSPLSRETFEAPEPERFLKALLSLMQAEGVIIREDRNGEDWYRL